MQVTKTKTTHLTRDEFSAAVERAAPGKTIVYAIGFLAADRNVRWAANSHEINACAEHALFLSGTRPTPGGGWHMDRSQRVVHLSQRKIEDGVYEYRATKATRCAS